MPITDQPGLAGYTVVRSLSEGSNGSVLLATRAGSDAQLVIKIFQPALLVDGDNERQERDRRVAAFLEASTLQQSVSKSAVRWAPIHDLGVLSGGAFYTTDYYPASAEWLIRAHVSMSGAVLRQIISGVVEALVHLGAASGRGHGNLTPTNVMLTDRNPRLARVALTDLAIDFQPDSRINAADDRWALGALIYALVKNAPVRRMMQLPMDADASWLALGRGGHQWLSLCNRLLAHDASQRPGLEEVAREVASPAASKAGRSVARAALAVACLTVMGGVGLTGYSYGYRWSYNHALEQNTAAIQSLIQERDHPEFLSAVSSDPVLAAHLPTLLESIAAEQEMGKHLPMIPTPAQFMQTLHVGDSFRQVTELFAAKNWATLSQIQDLQNQAHADGWFQVEKSLAQAVAGLPPRGAGDAAKNLQIFLLKAPDLMKSGDAMRSAWSGFANAIAPVIESGNSSAVAIATALQARTAAEMSLAVTPDLRSPAIAAQKLAGFLQNGKDYPALCGAISNGFNGALPSNLSGSLQALKPQPKIEVAKIESPKVVALPPQPVKTQEVKVAFPKVELPKIDVSKPVVVVAPPADTKVVVELRADLNDAKAYLDALGDAPDKPALVDRFDDLNRTAQEISKQQWTLSQSAEMHRLCDEAQVKLKSLWGDLQMARVNIWLTSVNDNSALIVPDHTSWKTAMQGLKQDAPRMAVDSELFKARQDSVALWVSFLPKLDEAIREAVKLPDAFDESLMTRRRLDLWTHIPAIDLKVPPPDPEVLIATVQRSAWSNEIGRFALDFPLKRPAMSLSVDDVRRRWLGDHASIGDAGFWQQEVISVTGSLHDAPWMNRDIATMNALADTAKMSREQLNRLIADLPSVDVLLFARLRLDALTGKDSWPATENELELAEGWLPQIKKAAVSIGMTNADLKQLVDRQRQTWFEFASNASKMSDIALAIHHAGKLEMNLDPTIRNQIGLALKDHPVLCYNILIYYAQQANGADVRDDLTHAVKSLPAVTAAKISAQFNRISPSPLSMAQMQWAMTGTASSWYLWPTTEFHPIAYIPPPPAPVVPNPAQTDDQQSAKVDQPPKSSVTQTPANGDSPRSRRGHTFVP